MNQRHAIITGRTGARWTVLGLGLALAVLAAGLAPILPGYQQANAAGRPDLVFSSVITIKQAPAPPFTKPMTFGGVTVANVGTAGAGPFDVKIVLSNGQTKTYRIAGLAPGKRHQISVSQAGYVCIRLAQVDSTSRVAESYEDNNIGSSC